MKLNDSEKRLLTPEGFIEAVEDKLPKTHSFKTAYELTEDEYERLFGRNKYSSYYSFKANKWKIKKRRR